KCPFFSFTSRYALGEDILRFGSLRSEKIGDTVCLSITDKFQYFIRVFRVDARSGQDRVTDHRIDVRYVILLSARHDCGDFVALRDPLTIWVALNSEREFAASQKRLESRFCVFKFHTIYTYIALALLHLLWPLA